MAGRIVNMYVCMYVCISEQLLTNVSVNEKIRCADWQSGIAGLKHQEVQTRNIGAIKGTFIRIHGIDTDGNHVYLFISDVKGSFRNRYLKG